MWSLKDIIILSTYFSFNGLSEYNGWMLEDLNKETKLFECRIVIFWGPIEQAVSDE